MIGCLSVSASVSVSVFPIHSSLASKGELVCSLLFRLDGRTMNVLEVHLESSILSGSMGSLEFQ